MKLRTIFLLLCTALAGCKQASIFHDVNVKATEWSVHDTKVCYFFGRDNNSNPDVGCWENESGTEAFNKDDRENDHMYLVNVEVPKDIYKRLSGGHNAKLHCVRDADTHLHCSDDVFVIHPELHPIAP
jgi:hypothetical protein